MPGGALSEVGAGSQSGIASVAVLHGTNSAQGKFGSLQDFWSILGTHGVSHSGDEGVQSKSVPSIEPSVSDGSSTKFPAKPIERSVAVGAAPQLAGPTVHGVTPNLLAAQSTPHLGTFSKDGASSDAKKHSKATDAEDTVAATKSSGMVGESGSSLSLLAPAPVEPVSATKAAHEAAGSPNKRGVAASRIPDGLVSKQTAGNGVAGVPGVGGPGVGAPEKVQPVGTDTAGSASGNSHGDAAAMLPSGTGLAVTQAAEASTAFAATLAPVMDNAVSTQGIARHTGIPADSAHGAVSTGDADGVVGYNGASGFSEPRTVVANSNVLEVGLTGGAHGWLRVRAELGHTGEVTASLVASNAGSAQSLDKQLGAMADYLKTEAVSIGSLTVSASEKSAGTDGSSGMSGGAGAGGGSSAGGGENARNGQNFVDWTSATPGTHPEEILSGMTQSLASGAGAVPSALLDSGVGGWLNVRV